MISARSSIFAYFLVMPKPPVVVSFLQQEVSSFLLSVIQDTCHQPGELGTASPAQRRCYAHMPKQMAYSCLKYKSIVLFGPGFQGQIEVTHVFKLEAVVFVNLIVECLKLVNCKLVELIEVVPPLIATA